MSKIEWTEKTWNPVTGCTEMSEACENCYAKVMAKRSKYANGSLLDGREWKEYPSLLGA